MAKIVIVGAGISGLALAYRLSERLPSAEVTILEERDRPGGTVWTERRDGFQVEIGPNGFLDTKMSTVDLARDVGLSDRLVAASPASGRNRFLFAGERLHRLPTSIVSLLRSDLLSWRAKLRLVSEPFRGPKVEDEDESVDAFARRRFGAEIANMLVDALVTGIYAGDPSQLSVKAAFPRLVEFERKHGSVLRGFQAAARQRRAERPSESAPRSSGSTLWSFRDGLRSLIDALAFRLRVAPIVGVRVNRLSRQTSGGLPRWSVLSEGNRSWAADVAVLTCPTYRQAEILGQLDETLAQWVEEIPYSRVAVVALGYRASDVRLSTDGFGFISPERTRRDVLGVQWCSSIFPGRAPPGCVLLRAMTGGWNRPDILDWDDGRLLSSVREELRITMSITAAPVFHSIIRWDRAIPQYTLGHLGRVARIESRTTIHSGLFLGGNAYHGVSLNDCTEQAVRLADEVVRFVDRDTAGP
jgi:oxygen-dependent protoporphyrinogen oxidase